MGESSKRLERGESNKRIEGNEQPLVEEYPTASILLRFANKQGINGTSISDQKREVRREIVDQAKTLSAANKKEVTRQAQLRKARESKKG